MFVNCTNHPYKIWNNKQRDAAKAYGEVVDIGFPPIEPDCTTDELRRITDDYAEHIESMKPDAILVAGEYSLTFMLVDRLLADGQNVVCSRSKRITTEIRKSDGTNEKKAIFNFEGFFKYEYYGRRRCHNG